MRELDQILTLWAETEAAGEPGVLATVVKTRGSSYRLPGARLLLTRSGRRAGSISGGCLEDDLVKKAWWLTEAGPVLRRYDTTPDGEIGFGLGCNGIIHVLLERMAPGQAAVLRLLEEVRAMRQPGVIAHLIHPASLAGQRLLRSPSGLLSNDVADPAVAAALAEHWSAETSSRCLLVNGVEIFLETLAPPVKLLVFGAGDDAVPLTALAKYLGWQVAVYDGRAHYARREKFPLADDVTVTAAGDSGVPVDRWTVAVLMSHSYSQDLANLRKLAGRPLRYLGVLGPRKRTLRLIEDAGLDSPSMDGHLHSPMGLDIGADGPEQVALSVLAEIQATLNRRDGSSLRHREGSIHAPDGEPSENAPFVVQSIVCA